jgi:hypothetical protein
VAVGFKPDYLDLLLVHSVHDLGVVGFIREHDGSLCWGCEGCPSCMGKVYKRGKAASIVLCRFFDSFKVLAKKFAKGGPIPLAS